jgi:hypothetical protein
MKSTQPIFFLNLARYASGPRPTAIKVRTNYFPLKLPENLVLYQYQVEIKKAQVLRTPPREADQSNEPPLGQDGSASIVSSGTSKKAKVSPILTDQGRWIAPMTARDGNDKDPIKLESSTALSRRILFETLKKMQDELPPLATLRVFASLFCCHSG